MKTYLAVALVAVLAISGCNNSDPYSVSVKGANDYAQVIGSVITVSQNLYTEKLIDAGEFKNLITWASLANQYGSTFLDTVVALHLDPNSGTVKYLDAANTFAANIQTLNSNGALKVKNAVAQQRITIALTAVQSYILALTTAISTGQQVVDTTIPVPPPAPAPTAPTPAASTPATPSVTPATPPVTSAPAGGN